MKPAAPQDVLALPAQDLASFAVLFSPGFQVAPHIGILISALEAVDRGEIRRLMVSMPPRHGKSHTASELFPAWFIGRHPEREIVAASYGQDLAEKFGRKVGGYVTDPRFAAIFPGCKVLEPPAAARFNVTAGGSYFGIGRGGGLTGRGANLLLIDDLFKDMEEAYSSAIRESVKGWYASVAITRLQKRGAIVIVSTRWHQDDLIGWLLREHADEGWTVISLPAIAERDEYFRKEGEALWPAQFDLAFLESVRAIQPATLWAADYQQRPVPIGGAVFKAEWLGSYRQGQAPKLERVVQAWDTAFKAGTSSDYSVCVTIGEGKAGYYLIDVARGRWEFPELKRQFQIQHERFSPNVVLIEDRASGQSLLQELKRETRLSLRASESNASKEHRAQLVTPMVETGKLFVPEAAPWRSAFVDELISFPGGVHDDQVDALVHALTYLRDHPWGTGGGFIGWGSVDEDREARFERAFGQVYDPDKFYWSAEERDRLMDEQAELDRENRRRWGGF